MILQLRLAVTHPQRSSHTRSYSVRNQTGKTRQGSPWLRQTLVEAAPGTARTKKSYLSAHYRGLAARWGSKRAIMAVGHSIVTISYYLLTCHTTYQDLGSNYFDERDREGVKRPRYVDWNNLVTRWHSHP